MTLLLIHAAVTLIMLGVILIVQLVHYPLFRYVRAADYEAFQAAHMRRITWIVSPAMTAELVTAGWIAWSPPLGLPAWMGWIGLALVYLGHHGNRADAPPFTTRHRLRGHASPPPRRHELAADSRLGTAGWTRGLDDRPGRTDTVVPRCHSQVQNPTREPRTANGDRVLHTRTLSNTSANEQPLFLLTELQCLIFYVFRLRSSRCSGCVLVFGSTEALLFAAHPPEKHCGSLWSVDKPTPNEK